MPDTRLFRLQKFSLTQEHSALRIGTDAVLLGCSVTIPEYQKEQADNNSASIGNDKLSEGRKIVNTDRIRILDIGTGCGIILLMLAQKAIEAGYTNIELTGIDIDSGSISDARTNAELFAQSFGFSEQCSSIGNGPSNDLSFTKPAAFPDCSQSNYAESCSGRSARLDIHLNCISLQDYTGTSQRQYDLIVSNPPFFINSLKSASAGKKTAKHNDSLSQKDLAAGVEKLLAPKGSFYLILPPSEAQIFMNLISENSKSSGANDIKLQRITVFRTTASKPAKRCVLRLRNCSNQQKLSESQTEKVNAAGANKCTIAVENMVIMRSNEDGKGPAATSSKKEAYTEEYISFTKDFLLY